MLVVLVIKFYVVKDGNFIGLFDVFILKIMVFFGEFDFDSLVWKEGMLEW